MSSEPLVSVLLPVYNAEAWLYEALNSILNQSYKNLEILLMNDGSTDGTKSVINRFKDKRIVCLVNESNLGISKTLNKGIEAARGEYIVRMDADDIAIKNRVEQQVKFLEEHENFVAVGSALKFMNEEKYVHYESDPKKIFSLMLYENPCAHPCLMIRSSALRKVMYKENFPHAEDFKLMQDLLSLGPVSNLSDVLLEYRKHDIQISSKNFALQKETHTTIVGDIFLRDFGIVIERTVFLKLFMYQERSLSERMYLVNCYFSAFLKSISRPRYSSWKIFTLLWRVIK